MADETQENGQLSAAPESREAQQAAPQQSVAPPSPDEGRIRAQSLGGREGLARGRENPDAELQQGLAAMPQPEGAKPGTPEEEDLGTNKGAMDKISDGMQKAFELIQRFMKQIQSMGSSSLRGMASTLSMLGFKKAAEWLNEMAGADYAELMSAMKKNNLTLAPLNPEDPNAKAQTELSEGAQAQMADQYKVLAQTRGPAFTREVFYSETVTAWKKQGGNGSKTQLTVEDLQAMAAASKALPATLPGQVAQGPEFVSPLESLSAPLNVMGGAPVKVIVLQNKTIGLQAGANGEILISVAGGAPVRYRLSPNVDGVTGLAWQMRSMLLSKDGLQIDGTATYKVGTTDMNSPYVSRLVSMAEIRPFLEAVVKNPNGVPVVGADFRFERVPA